VTLGEAAVEAHEGLPHGRIPRARDQFAAIAHPEPPRADPKADEMSREELLRQLKCAPARDRWGVWISDPAIPAAHATRVRISLLPADLDKWIERVQSLKVR
jgi:hypothetical protein